MFGHNKISCLKLQKSISNSGVKKNLLITEHGFQLVLKCMKLKRVLLDHLCVQRSEGIEYLEELLYHFDGINEVNIGRNYKVKFGDPDIQDVRVSPNVDSLADFDPREEISR